MLEIDPHPLLDLARFVMTFPGPLDRHPSPDWLVALLGRDAPSPFECDDRTRGSVRDLLRHGGFKPTGRSKPASEYLLRTAQEGISSINAVVDLGNVASLHSGLPISVVDLDLVAPPLSVGLGHPGESYVFNSSGQTIDLGGLVLLRDARGPCASPVKDSQRTKTSGSTTRVLTLIWGTRALPGRAAGVERWWRTLSERLGATIEA